MGAPAEDLCACGPGRGGFGGEHLDYDPTCWCLAEFPTVTPPPALCRLCQPHENHGLREGAGGRARPP